MDRAPSAHVVLAPASRARRAALVLSAIAVVFSIGFGVYARRAIAVMAAIKGDAAIAAAADDPEPYMKPIMFALVFLLFALLFRMIAAICELLWLERTWSNLPEHLRTVGPVEKVSSGMVVGLSFVPGVAWLWKLGLVVGIAKGFEDVRARVPFRAPVPKKLGMAAVIVGWVPGLNVYLAPFLWEMFATRMDVVCTELASASVFTPAETAAPPAPQAGQAQPAGPS
ncbi:MAG: hypothetical protein KF819_11760 [Labilithrix sp.]|nr:hypothetical protein [Labilithrix sp.]